MISAAFLFVVIAVSNQVRSIRGLLCIFWFHSCSSCHLTHDQAEWRGFEHWCGEFRHAGIEPPVLLNAEITAQDVHLTAAYWCQQTHIVPTLLVDMYLLVFSARIAVSTILVAVC